jgi:hypothetical protein
MVGGSLFAVAFFDEEKKLPRQVTGPHSLFGAPNA